MTNLRVSLDFYQEKSISDLVKAATYRIHFVSSEGEMISNEVIYRVDSKSEKAGDRIGSLKFDIKRKNYDKNLRYFLKVINDKTNVELLSRQVIMDLPFTDDFGFGV